MNARISRDEKILSFSVLIVAVFSASTAGAIFSVLEDEPLFSQQKGDKSAMLLASSRLTATAIVQSPIFLYCCYNYYHYRGGEEEEENVYTDEDDEELPPSTTTTTITM